MPLLKKVESTNHGLIGITESGKEVSLSVPNSCYICEENGKDEGLCMIDNLVSRAMSDEERYYEIKPEDIEFVKGLAILTYITYKTR